MAGERGENKKRQEELWVCPGVVLSHGNTSPITTPALVQGKRTTQTSLWEQSRNEAGTPADLRLGEHVCSLRMDSHSLLH